MILLEIHEDRASLAVKLVRQVTCDRIACSQCPVLTALSQVEAGSTLEFDTFQPSDESSSNVSHYLDKKVKIGLFDL